MFNSFNSEHSKGKHSFEVECSCLHWHRWWFRWSLRDHEAIRMNRRNQRHWPLERLLNCFGFNDVYISHFPNLILLIEIPISSRGGEFLSENNPSSWNCMRSQNSSPFSAQIHATFRKKQAWTSEILKWFIYLKTKHNFTSHPFQQTKNPIPSQPPPFPFDGEACQTCKAGPPGASGAALERCVKCTVEAAHGPGAGGAVGFSESWGFSGWDSRDSVMGFGVGMG